MILKTPNRGLCTIVAFLLVCSFLAHGAHAEDRPQQNPALKKLYSELTTLVRRYYPKATSHLLKDSIHFEYETRIFLIHEPLKTGEWQDPREERGPKPGGILCDITLQKGKYEGQAVVPQAFDKRYFILWIAAPYSEKQDCHLRVRLSYPGNVSQDFLKEFRALIAEFEKYMD